MGVLLQNCLPTYLKEDVKWGWCFSEAQVFLRQMGISCEPDVSGPVQTVPILRQAVNSPSKYST